MSQPPFRKVALALTLLLLLSLAAAAYYLLVLRAPGLPYPWQLP